MPQEASKKSEVKAEPEAKSDPLVDLLSMVVTRLSWNSEAEGVQAWEYLEELKGES